MNKADELELFEYLARQRKFRDWIDSKITEDTSVLVQALDIDQLRRAQGRVGLLQSMVKLMDAAAAKR